MKRVTIHLDALIVITLLFLLSVAANVYLWRQNSLLFKEKVEALWQTQDIRSSWDYTRGTSD